MGFGYKQRSPDYCYTPGAKEPYKVSRSKIDLFIACPRCFYIDQRLGLKRPDMPPFSLNNAVDELLKRECDAHRKAKTPHPSAVEYGVKAVPFNHPELDAWRDALRRGVQYRDEKHNLIIRGGIDDVWINENEELHVVDYKATSKKEEVSLDAEWQDAYKRQVEVYQWLLRKNGFKVSDTAYFLYANGNSDADAFDGKLEFSLTILPYVGDDAWIEKVIDKLHKCLNDEKVPKAGKDCEYCIYRNLAGKTLLELHKKGLVD